MGMIGFMRQQSLKRRHRGFIWGMYVELTHAGTGIGRQLIEACLERTTQLEGLERIDLSVLSGAPTARRLYEKVGFKAWGVDENAIRYGEEYLDEIFMKLDTGC